MDNEKDEHPIVGTFMSILKTMLENKEQNDSIEWSRMMQEELEVLRKKIAIEGHGFKQWNLQGRVLETYLHGLKSQLKGVTTIIALLEMHQRAFKIMEDTLSVIIMMSQDGDEETKKEQQMILNLAIVQWLEDAKSQFEKHK